MAPVGVAMATGLLFAALYGAGARVIIRSHSHQTPLRPSTGEPANEQPCQSLPATSNTSLRVERLPPVAKSDFDEREYRAGRLRANGLVYLLVSDPATTKAAASMDVGVGSAHDPVQIPGLAHFLEHMLFMGSKKYPKEGEYDNWLTERGGGSNAFTAALHTNYYFDINPSSLTGALDRFARFFIDPLLTRSAVEREAHAVDAEHSKNLQSDAWRQDAVLRALAIPGSNFAKFGTGSLQTLMTNPNATYMALRALHGAEYCAENMKLVVVGREALDDLEALVATSFDSVPRMCAGKPEKLGETVRENETVNNLADETDHSEQKTPLQYLPSASRSNSTPQPENGHNITTWERVTLSFSSPFEPQQQRGFSIAIFEPVADTRTLAIHWPIPPQREIWDMKIAEYVEELIGSEGRGSIFAILQSRDWAESVSVGTDERENFDIFSVEIELTPLGCHHVPQVLAVVYAYINVLRHDEQAIAAWRYKELAQISKNRFRFAEKSDSDSFASGLASAMRTKPASKVLSAVSTWDHFNAFAIKAILTYLTPCNSVVLYSKRNQTDMASGTDGPVTLDKIERWYKVPYAIVALDTGTQTTIDAIDKAVNIHPVVTEYGLGVSKLNEFVPEPTDIAVQKISPRFQLQTHPFELPLLVRSDYDAHGKAPAAADTADTADKAADSSQNDATFERVMAWWAQDARFNRPHVNVRVSIRVPGDPSAPHAAAIADIFEEIFDDSIAVDLYAPSSAGYHMSMSADATGVDIAFRGYRNALPALIDLTAQYLRNPGILTESRFSRAKARVLRAYANARFQQPIRRAGELLRATTLRPFQLSEQLESAVSSIKVAEVAAYQQMLFRDAFLEVLVHGDANETAAASIVNRTTLAFPTRTVTYARERPHPQVHQVLALSQFSGKGEKPTGSVSAVTVRSKTLDPDNINSAVVDYFQLGLDERYNHSRLYSHFLGSMAGPAAFHQLRSVEQLGYIATARMSHMCRVVGFTIEVQSAVKTATEIASRTRAFVGTLTDLVEKLSAEKFKLLVSAARESLSKPPQSLSEATSGLWEKITSRRYDFDRRLRSLRELDEIEAQGPDAFRAFFRALFKENKISVQVQAAGSAGNTPAFTTEYEEKDGFVVTGSTDGIKEFRSDRAYLDRASLKPVPLEATVLLTH